MSEMRRLKFTIKRKRQRGAASHATVIRDLPIDGIKKVWGILSNTGCHPSKEKWAVGKAAALEVSATGRLQSIVLDTRHVLRVEVDC